MKLKHYIDDGANWQAQAVLAYLRYWAEDIEYVAHDKERDINRCDIGVTRYDNCREQGYIFFVRFHGGKSFMMQRNYAVYQHRNSDTLCIVSNDISTFNDPLATDIWETMKDKWDTAQNFSYGEILKCAEWIEDDMKDFLHDCITKEKQEKNTVIVGEFTLVPVWKPYRDGENNDKIVEYEIRKDGITQGYIAAETFEKIKNDYDKLLKTCDDIVNLPF